VTRLRGEQWYKAYAREFDLNICIGTFFSFYDSLQPSLYFIPAMIHKIHAEEKGVTLEIQGVNGRRDFLTVPQLCQIIQHLFACKHQGAINVGTGVGTPLIGVVKKIASLMGRDVLIINAKIDEVIFYVTDIGSLSSIGSWLSSQFDQVLTECPEKPC